MENPFSTRLGGDFFRSLPRQPGVYFFYASEGTLLYIGQSLDLRARIGSYRHVTPEQNARRTLRLVHRIARIEWQVCATALEAVELEARLLLQHRPPFNRAGVWQPDPWWLELKVTAEAATEGSARLGWQLSRGLEARSGALGPLPSGFRQVFGSALRCLHRLAYPQLGLAGKPRGLFEWGIPLQMDLAWPEASSVAAWIQAFAEGRPEELLAQLDKLPAATEELQQAYWLEEVEILHRFAKKQARIRAKQAKVGKDGVEQATSSELVRTRPPPHPELWPC